jgi:hypothetical protein
MMPFENFLTPLLVALNVSDGDATLIGALGAVAPTSAYIVKLVRMN